jgi:hypothetical protein
MAALAIAFALGGKICGNGQCPSQALYFQR